MTQSKNTLSYNTESKLSLKKQIRIAIGSAALICSLGFAGNTYAATSATNANIPAQESIMDACQFLPSCLTFIIQKTSENRLDDAFSALPTMLGFIAKHDYFKNTLLTKISSKAMQGLQKSIHDKLTIQLNGAGLAKLGIDVAAGIIIDEVSMAIKNATGSNNYAGAAWFLMTQSYALGNVWIDSKEMPVPVAFLKNQAGLLVAVVKKDIEAYAGLKKDVSDATASEIRSFIITHRISNLSADYQKYFQSENLTEKNNSRIKIINGEKKLLANYLNGSSYNIFASAKKQTANAVFNTWKSELAGNLVKEEMTTRANISALVLNGKYEEAKKVSKSFFGLESYALSLITATEPLTGGRPGVGGGEGAIGVTPNYSHGRF
ncbi:MAG: hypothetical protein WCI06_01365 [Methylococcaceae bacterium]